MKSLIHSLLKSFFKFIFKNTDHFLAKSTRIAFHKKFKSFGKHLFYENKTESYILNRNETISNSIFINDEFDFDKIKKVLKIIKKKYYLVDIGANIGSISLPAIKRNYFKQAICFEPDKASFRLLKANILINDIENKMSAFNLAISDKKGTKKLLSDNKYNRGNNMLVENSAKTSKNITLVKTDILDNFCSKLNKGNALIKIDVQGHEGNILKKAKKTLTKKIPIMLEFEPVTMKKNWINDYKYLFMHYNFFYNINDLNPKKNKLTINALDELYNSHLKNKTYTDLLFI